MSTPSIGESFASLVTTAILVRHCKAPKTDSGKDEDRVLNEVGQAQAKKLADRLKGIEFDTLLASPLRRVGQSLAIATPSSGLSIQTVTELTCPTDGVHPVDVMFNAPGMGYAPLSKYFAHTLGEHLQTWAQTALVAICDRLDKRPNQTVLVGGHAVLQPALGWAICGSLIGRLDVKEASAMMLDTELGEGEAFELILSDGTLKCRHIMLD